MPQAASPALTIRLSSPLVDRAQLSGEDAIAQMADDYRRLAAMTGSVTREDLRVATWPYRLIDLYGDRARERAEADSIVSRDPVPTRPRVRVRAPAVAQ